jgi:PmbA protein
MRSLSPAARLAEELAAQAGSVPGADEVRIWVEDSRWTEHRISYDSTVTQRSGTHRRVTVVFRVGERWVTEVLEGAAPSTRAAGTAPRLPSPRPAQPAERMRQMVLDPATGRPSPEVLGAEYGESATAVTVLAGTGLTAWEHTHRRLWHWIGGTGGNYLEGTLTWADRLPDPALPRTERAELLAARGTAGQARGAGGWVLDRMPVLLRPCVALHLVDLLASVLNGRNVLTGMRMLRERVGQRIATPAVTVVDDGGLNGPYGALVDDEGVPTARNVLLEAGVLRGFLHSQATAAACGTRPNGCAVRNLPGGLAGPGVRGFALLPGDGVRLRERLGTGLEAVAVSRPGVRCGGGKRLRLGVFGWLVRDGQRHCPVGPVFLEVGLFGWLRSVVACGPSLHHSAVFRGLAAPAVLLSEAVVRWPG